MPNKHYLKLGPKAVCFSSSFPPVNLATNQVAEVDAEALNSPEIQRALAGGHIVETTAEEFEGPSELDLEAAELEIAKAAEAQAKAEAEAAEAEAKAKAELEEDEEDEDSEDEEDEDEDEEDAPTKSEMIDALKESPMVKDKKNLAKLSDKELTNLYNKIKGK